MTLWILDTDTVSLLLERHPKVSQRVIENGADVAISIVMVQELFNGWVVRINNAKSVEDLVRFYDKFYKTVRLCKRVPVLNFDQSASEQLANLLRSRSALAKQKVQKDMRIAAITLANHTIVVTRNTRDFSQVPGLMIEDWTV